MSYGRRCEERWMNKQAKTGKNWSGKSVSLSFTRSFVTSLVVNTFDKGAIKEQSRDNFKAPFNKKQARSEIIKQQGNVIFCYPTKDHQIRRGSRDDDEEAASIEIRTHWKILRWLLIAFQAGNLWIQNLCSSFCNSAYAVVGKNWWICIFCNSNQSSKWIANNVNASFTSKWAGKLSFSKQLFVSCCSSLSSIRWFTVRNNCFRTTTNLRISLESCRVPTLRQHQVYLFWHLLCLVSTSN